MINLLPPTRLLDIKTARNNTVLRRYIELLLLSMVIIGLAVAASYYFLDSRRNDVQSSLEANKKTINELKKTQDQAQGLSTTINTVAKLLAQNIKFSEVLTKIGNVMPEGASLTNVQFEADELNAPLIVTVDMVNEERGAVLRNNLAKSELFQDAKIKSIIAIEAPEEGYPYKYTAILQVYFKENEAKR